MDELEAKTNFFQTEEFSKNQRMFNDIEAAKMRLKRAQEYYEDICYAQEMCPNNSLMKDSVEGAEKELYISKSRYERIKASFKK